MLFRSISGYNCIFVLLLVAIVFVDTSDPPTAADNVSELLLITASTNLVIDEAPSVVNDIESPTTNSSVNLVLKPVTAVPEFATDNVPVNVALSPLDHPTPPVTNQHLFFRSTE